MSHGKDCPCRGSCHSKYTSCGSGNSGGDGSSGGTGSGGHGTVALNKRHVNFSADKKKPIIKVPIQVTNTQCFIGLLNVTAKLEIRNRERLFEHLDCLHLSPISYQLLQGSSSSATSPPILREKRQE